MTQEQAEEMARAAADFGGKDRARRKPICYTHQHTGANSHTNGHPYRYSHNHTNQYTHRDSLTNRIELLVDILSAAPTTASVAQAK